MGNEQIFPKDKTERIFPNDNKYFCKQNQNLLMRLKLYCCRYHRRSISYMRPDSRPLIGNADSFLNIPKLLFCMTDIQKNVTTILLKQIVDRTRMNVRRNRPQPHMIKVNQASLGQNNVNFRNYKSSIATILLPA